MYDFRNHNVIFKMLIFFQCRKKEDAPTADTEEVEDAFQKPQECENFPGALT